MAVVAHADAALAILGAAVHVMVVVILCIILRTHVVLAHVALLALSMRLSLIFFAFFFASVLFSLVPHVAASSHPRSCTLVACSGASC